MNIRQRIRIGLTAICGLFIFAACSSTDEYDGNITIGIIQTASHPALDQARDGFISEMRKHTNQQITFIIQNGEGSVAQLQSIAKNFHANPSIKAIYAIATPAAQEMVAIEKCKPVFFAAVTDPVNAGLIRPYGNACGTIDHVDVAAEIEMLQTLLPGAQRVAILFNPAEVNSIVIKDEMVKELKKRHLEVVTVGMQQESDASTAALYAVSHADVLLTPTDNLVATTLPVIVRVARENNTPLIVSDNLLVHQGALASRGVDYYHSGQQVGLYAVSVLMEGKNPRELPLVTAEIDSVVINRELLREFNVKIPKNFNDFVKFVSCIPGNAI